MWYGYQQNDHKEARSKKDQHRKGKEEDNRLSPGGRDLGHLAPQDQANPLKYRLQLYHEITGETLVRYDIHHGKSHHRHFLGQESAEVWQGVEQTVVAFQQDIETIKAYMREGKL